MLSTRKALFAASVSTGGMDATADGQCAPHTLSSAIRTPPISSGADSPGSLASLLLLSQSMAVNNFLPTMEVSDADLADEPPVSRDPHSSGDASHARLTSLGVDRPASGAPKLPQSKTMVVNNMLPLGEIPDARPACGPPPPHAQHSPTDDTRVHPTAPIFGCPVSAPTHLSHQHTMALNNIPPAAQLARAGSDDAAAYRHAPPSSHPSPSVPLVSPPSSVTRRVTFSIPAQLSPLHPMAVSNTPPAPGPDNAGSDDAGAPHQSKRPLPGPGQAPPTSLNPDFSIVVHASPPWRWASR
jgi:hypothetical protein